MIHLYAVTARDPAPLPVAGIEGAALRCHPCGPLFATVSEHARAPAASAANATAHAGVVAAVAERAPAVPIRFGIDHVDVPALRDALADAEPALLDTLERTGHAVEFVVRWRDPTPREAPVTIPDGASEARGRAYLEGRLEARRAARDVHEQRRTDLRTATEPLDDLALETTEHVGRGGPERCFLVARATASAFTAAAGDVLAGRDDLLLGGPWPPYTFAGDGTPP